MQTDWTEIKSPPPPFLHAYRKTAKSGLHVIVAVRQGRGVFEAFSILDHGTTRKTILKEAGDPDLGSIVKLVLRLCDRYDEDDVAGVSRPAKYSYVDFAGKMHGPVFRDSLFQLMEDGIIDWGSQVWRAEASGGVWESVDQAVGFSELKRYCRF